jgi:hypothetical protein
LEEVNLGIFREKVARTVVYDTGVTGAGSRGPWTYVCSGDSTSICCYKDDDDDNNNK